MVFVKTAKSKLHVSHHARCMPSSRHGLWVVLCACCCLVVGVWHGKELLPVKEADQAVLHLR